MLQCTASHAEVLMATYKKWLKEVYPFEDFLAENKAVRRAPQRFGQDNFEDMIWKSRAVLEKKDPL